MDEQGIYCPQCRAYVHFWLIPMGGRRFGSGREERPLPDTLMEMPKACRRCGHKGTYKTTDLRTRRVPTTPAMGVPVGPTWRIASTIGSINDDTTPGPA